MTSKQEMNREVQAMALQLAQARQVGQVQAAGNIYLTAVVKVQAAEIARLRVRLAKVRWPWRRRAWLRVRLALRCEKGRRNYEATGT